MYSKPCARNDIWCHPLPVYVNISCLANAMAAILRLSVHRWVPVAVVENDGIRSGQIYADPAGTSGQDEDEYPLVRVEPFHQGLAIKRNIQV